MYGGLNPDVNNVSFLSNYLYSFYLWHLTQVYFTHGLIDPWRVVGVQNDINESSPVDIIPGK